MDGLISARELEKRGKPIYCLDNQLIYPNFGVYMPNSQEYLNVFQNYIRQVDLSGLQSYVDLGTGSGILPIILKENGFFKSPKRALAIDFCD